MVEEIFRSRNADVYLEGKQSLSDLNINLFKGEILGVFGTFYSGQSTLFDLISGDIKQNSGTLFFNGKKWENNGKHPITARINKVTFLLDGLSVWENMLRIQKFNRYGIFINPHAQQKTLAVLLKDYNIDIKPSKKAGTLNNFERMLIEIFIAVLQKAEIIMIEDFSWECTLDEFAKLSLFMKQLKKNGVSFLIASYQMEILLYYCDRVAFLVNGRIVKNINNNFLNRTDINKILTSMVPNVNEEKNKKHKIDQNLLTIFNIEAQMDDKINLSLHKGEVIIIIEPSMKVLDILKKRIFMGTQSETSEMFFKGKKCRYLKKMKDAYFLDAITLDWIIDEMSPLDNICMGIYKKISRLGILKKQLLVNIAEEFSRWYGEPKLITRTDSKNISKREKIAITLFRIKLINPDILICNDLTMNNDLYSYHMVQEFLKELVEKGTAICGVVSNFVMVDDIADKYIVVAKNKILYDVDYSQLENIVEWGKV